LKERIGYDSSSGRRSPTTSFGMKTPDFDLSDDEADHDSFDGSMV